MTAQDYEPTVTTTDASGATASVSFTVTVTVGQRGAWLFRGTRVPVASLFENLRDGATVDQFLDWFPEVERWQVESVLDHETRSLAGATAS